MEYTATPLSSSESEDESVEYTATPLSSSESEDESVEYTATPLSSSESEDESVEYTGTAFTYDSPNGISLHFPTVAECGAAIKISIKVVNNDYILPEGYEDMDLVSSMFKITASADLPAPVTVRMEHCAVVEEDDSLVHMIAHGPPPYKFKLLEGGKFPIREFYGEIEMKKFCTLTQSQKLKTPMSLSVHIFYHDHCSATFVATQNLPNLNEAVKREFDAVRVFKISMSCNHSTKKIILTLPVTQRGWLVEPDIEPAQIETRLIRAYRPGKIPPTVPLKMRWTGDGSPVEESVSIEIKGVLLKSFKIHCKPEQSSLTPSAIQSQQHTPHEAEPSLSTQPASPLSPPLPSPSLGSDVSHTSPAPSTPQHRHDSSLSLSVESTALRRSNAIFTRAGDPDGLVTVLYSNFLLTLDEKARALHQSLTARQKMEEIFQTMERRVSVSPSDFHTLLSVLKAEPATKALGEEMQGQ